MRARFHLLFFSAVLLLLLPNMALGQESPEESESSAPPIETVDALRVDQCKGDEAARTASERTSLASQLYDRGLVLYEEGDYRGAIDSFVASYCAKPHPASFYNIAQSQERILNFELSIAYFERYVAESEPDAPMARKAKLRAEVLGLLPAQIRVATVPEGASITIHDDAGLRARGTANQDAPLEVVRGKYTMHVSMPGYQDVTRSIETKPGQPYSYYLSLEPQTGILHVTATPNDSRIFLNDRLVGAGTYEESLDVGTYEVTAEAPGRKTRKESISIKAGERNELSLTLDPPPRSGRNTLLLASSLGLGVTGAASMTYIFGQQTPATVAGFFASTAVGFGSAYYGIPESTTRGDAWFMTESALIGLVEGLLLARFLVCDIENETRSCDTEEESRAVAAASLGTGLLGAALSVATHKRLALDTGDAAVIGSAAFWGMSASALLYAIFDSDPRIQEPLLLSGLNVGLVAGAGVLATNDLSLERMALIDLGGVGGLLGGALLGGAFQRSDEQLQHFALLGMVGGLVGATALTIGMDEAQLPKRSKRSESQEMPSSFTPAIGTTIDAAGTAVPNLGFSLRLR